MNLDQAPNDVLLEIFYNAKPSELNRICQSSKRMQQLCNNEQLWKNKYLNTFGPKDTRGSWKTAYISRSLTKGDTVYSVIAYKPNKRRSETVAIINGNNIYDVFAEILNDNNQVNPKLYTILKNTYQNYLKWAQRDYDDGHLMSREECEQEKKLDPTLVCDINTYFAQLPISGQELQEIIANVDFTYYADFASSDEFIVIEPVSLYTI